MNKKYSKIVAPQNYWLPMLETDSGKSETILMLIQKVDELYERIYNLELENETLRNEVHGLNNTTLGRAEKLAKKAYKKIFSR